MEQQKEVTPDTKPILNLLPTINDPRLSVHIRGETRFPKLTEPLFLPEDLFEQAGKIGRQLFIAAYNLG